MRSQQLNRRQRGVAMFMALLALLLLSAIAFGMMYMANMETDINANYRSSQVAFSAAKAGLEEARDRLRAGSTDRIRPFNAPCTALPNGLPGTPCNVLYLANTPAAGDPPITPWLPNTPFSDIELCHEGFAALTPADPNAATPGAPCNAPPTGPGNWFAQAACGSNSANRPGNPYAAMPGVLNYKWVRITYKANGSLGGFPAAAPGYAVDPAQPAANQVCWDGNREQVIPAGTTCAASIFAQLYMLTSLAVTPNGSRRMAAMEVAPSVFVPVPAAVYSTSDASAGDALNITGYADKWCKDTGLPDVTGMASGTSTATPPGGGNVTGTPPTQCALPSNPPCSGPVPRPPNIPQIAARLQPTSKPIDPPGPLPPGPPATCIPNPISTTNIRGTGAPTAQAKSPCPAGPPVGTPYRWAGPFHEVGGAALLGTPPTVTMGFCPPNPSPYCILSKVPGSGSPMNVYAPGDLYLGPPIASCPLCNGSGPVTGYGALIVNGNLTINVSAGFNYYGLILVTGNLTLVADPGAAVNPLVFGAMLVGGRFSAPISSMAGSVSIMQDACMVNDATALAPLRVVAFRELNY